MLVDRIKAAMTQALRARDGVAKNVLGLALGEIQSAEARTNRPLREDEAQTLVRKLVKSNEETLSLAAAEGADSARAVELRREVEVLSLLLPATLSVEAVMVALEPLREALRGAKSEGQAVGLAMKHLKASGALVDAPNVQDVVKRLRA